jgi:hypothetical protein
MKRQIACGVLFAMSLGASAGCHYTVIDGEGLDQELVVYEDVRIHGESNIVTLLPESEVPSLHIWGEGNRVTISEGASVYKIKVVGEGNEVVCPPGMSFQYWSSGEGNRLRYHR